jgi:hypothetical protein
MGVTGPNPVTTTLFFSINEDLVFDILRVNHPKDKGIKKNFQEKTDLKLDYFGHLWFFRSNP